MHEICIPKYVETLLRELEGMGHRAYVVGGCVRDSMLGKEPTDWDVCTDATPEQMKIVFRKRKVIETGVQHGTLTVRSQGHNVEVTTFRLEGDYSDNRHPDRVEFVDRVEEDLSRRDFTINAMAYSPKSGLVDTFGGQTDLADGMIRCVGEPDVRFREDGLRILRALRFAARFQFSIETETSYSIRRNRLLLENISAERIYKELQGILPAQGAGDMLLGFPEVFTVVFPETERLIGEPAERGRESKWARSVRAVCGMPQGSFGLRLAMLLHELEDAEVNTAMRRLKCDHATTRLVKTIVAELRQPLPGTRPEMRRLIGRLTKPLVHDLLTAQCVVKGVNGHSTAGVREARYLLEEVLDGFAAYTVRDLAVTGESLMEEGIPSGPGLGKVLEQLLREVQDETLKNDKDALLKRAREIF